MCQTVVVAFVVLVFFDGELIGRDFLVRSGDNAQLWALRSLRSVKKNTSQWFAPKERKRKKKVPSCRYPAIGRSIFFLLLCFRVGQYHKIFSKGCNSCNVEIRLEPSHHAQKKKRNSSETKAMKDRQLKKKKNCCFLTRQ